MQGLDTIIFQKRSSLPMLSRVWCQPSLEIKVKSCIGDILGFDPDPRVELSSCIKPSEPYNDRWSRRVFVFEVNMHLKMPFSIALCHLCMFLSVNISLSRFNRELNVHFKTL